MESNPYQAPATPVAAPVEQAADDWDKLRTAAKLHRLLNYCAFAYILTFFSQLALGVFAQNSGQESRVLAIGFPVVALCYAAVLVAGLALTIFLASKLFHPAVMVVLAVTTLIPCLGLISIFIVSKRAEIYLTNRGLKVGLFGAVVPDQPPAST